MQKFISLSIVSAIILSSSPADARFIGKTVTTPVSAQIGLALPGGVNATVNGVNLSLAAPSLTTTLPVLNTTLLPQTVQGRVQKAVRVRSGPLVTGRKAVVAAKSVKPIAVRQSLETVAAEIAPAAKKEGGAAVHEVSNRFFDSAAVNAADPNDGVDADAPAPRHTKGLKPKRTLAQRATLPAITVTGVAAAAAVIAEPTLPAQVGAWLLALPGVDTVLQLFALAPVWAQTGIWVGAGFGVASIAPRIVRPAVKAIFQHLEWNKLREDWLTNVITYASWFGAVTYAVGMLGGWEALVVNSSVFALTTTFAIKDVAANVADGFYLHQSRDLQVGEPFEALGVEGTLVAANPRFAIIDTSADKELGYDRVLIPNQKLSKAGIGSVAKQATPNARKFQGTAALSFAGVAAAWTALGPLGQSIATIIGAFWVGRRLNNWVKSQEVKAESFRKSDEKQYKRHIFRARVLWWFRNSIYLGGLGLVMHLFGVPVAGMVSGLGIFAAAAGFYMKSVSENLVGGLMIAAYLPFSAGDTIEVGKYKGVVAGMTQSELRLWTDEKWTGGTRGYVDVPLTYVMKEMIKIKFRRDESGNPMFPEGARPGS
ncbi:MAG: hypothetical protein COB53_07160 [Elusimicrobia bacterium]|nr:MAG: hypothetical protein COB53_07160 [Elusimicrobiota bacterium]